MVVASEAGHTSELRCCYHGWTYHLDGRLKAVPLQHGYPREFQDFMESIAYAREPISGAQLARDTVVTLYSAYLSAERRGVEIEIPQ